jgi:hypothetical protein
VTARIECQEARRLLDAYLMALSLEDSVRAACRFGEATPRELSDAHEQLVTARSRYWTHARQHNCRTNC